MDTLNDFLMRHGACEDGYEYAKDMTLEEFLAECPNSGWILWLFARSNPNSKRELNLARGHCSSTVLHLMKDQRSKDAVKATIDFGEGKIGMQELVDARVPAYVDNAAYADYADAISRENELETANICRKYLPLKLWHIKLLKKGEGKQLPKGAINSETHCVTVYDRPLTDSEIKLIKKRYKSF